jgi:hypothetical protein
MNSNDMHDLYDIYDLWHQPFWQTRSFVILMMVLGVVLLMGMMWILFRWYRAKKSKSEWEVALEEIQQLQRQLLYPHVDVPHMYCTLTMVLKRYFMKQYGYGKVSDTDHEFLNAIKNSALEASVQEAIVGIFAGSVAIKFAHQKTAQRQIEQDLTRAADSIKRTIPLRAK